MNKVKYVLAGACVSAVSALAPTAKAEPMTHDGFYLALEAGLGYMSATADGPFAEEKLSGTTFSSALLLGGTVGPAVIGGGFTYDTAFSPSYELNGRSVELEDVTLYLIGIGAFVDVYPDPTQGLHFLGFVGWGGLEMAVNGNAGGSDPTGMLLTLGAGYDFWLANEWSVGPLARFTYAPLSKDDLDVNTTHFALVADFKFH